MIWLAGLLGEPNIRGAIAYDLLHCGMRLRDFPDGGVTCGDLVTIVRHATPGSAVWRAMSESAEWSWDRELLHRVEFDLRQLLHMWSGEESAPAPLPINVPWREPFTSEGDDSGEADVFDWDEGIARFMPEGWASE